MPGVLIIESMAQTGGLLLLQEVTDREKKLLYFVSIDNARFRRPVVPGDQLRIEMNVVAWRHGFCKLEGRATVNGELAAEATLMCKMVDLETEQAPASRTRRKSAMSEIDPRAVVSPSAKLGKGVQWAPLPSSETKSNSAMAAFSKLTPWSAAFHVRPQQSFLLVFDRRRRSAGSDLHGPARPARSGRRQRVSRILHRESRHDQGRRRHARGQPQSDHGLRAHRPRLPDRRSRDSR